MKFLIVDFFNLSIVACWMIIIVLILRLFLKRTPKVFNCILWCMVWLRMIIPVSVTSHLSMIPSIELLDKKYLYEHIFRINTGIYFFDYGINEALIQNNTIPTGTHSAVHAEGGGSVVRQTAVVSIEACRSSARRKTSGSSLPRAEALRRIPRQAF